MSKALAGEHDLSSDAQWTLPALRDFFLTVINDNDRRYEVEMQAIRETIHAADLRYEEQHRSGRAHGDAGARILDAKIEASRTEWQILSNSMKEALSVALTVQTQAVAKAEIANEKRFDAVNEFRETLSDQQRMLMPRSEAEVIFKGLTEKVDNQAVLLRTRSAASKGQHAGWGFAAGVIGLALAVVSIFEMLARSAKLP